MVATTTNSTPARTSTPSSSPPPTSSMRSTASRPSAPGATPTSRSPWPTPWRTRALPRKAVEGHRADRRRSARSAAAPRLSAGPEYMKSGKFGDIVMVEMTWNVNQPGRWRRPDVVPLLQGRGHRLEPLCSSIVRRTSSTRASISSSASSGRTPRAFPTSGSSTRSTPCTGSPATRIRAGRRQRRHLPVEGRPHATGTPSPRVFDYGPLDDPTKGFQVQLQLALHQLRRRRQGALLLQRRHDRHGQEHRHRRPAA